YPHLIFVFVVFFVYFRCAPSAAPRWWYTPGPRVGGAPTAAADDYHFYITNLPRKWFLPADIATIYRYRWAVELLFRELKTLYDLDEFDTSSPAVVEILLYAAILTLVVSRALLDLVIEYAEEDAVFPPERWAATLRSHAQRILKRLSNYLDYSPPPLLERMAADAQKIHQERPILQERLATAAQSTAGVS
ncbi:transposase, partial [Halococcus sp. PRR34]|uniref:transposase n=1 Tax=Halococcus sp. PRR34 TaxID=3020830 RepID=UPI0023613A98